VEGVQAHPQNFDLVKIRAKSLKIWGKSVKTFAKSLKNLGKLSENTNVV